MTASRPTAGTALGPGTRLGPYEVLAPLGAGGMGEVYRARDERLGREVAVKVLPAESAADPDRLRRFEQEAKAAGALNHPNLLGVFDTGLHHGAPYIVFELLEGVTLRQRLGGGPLPVRKAVDYAVQIAHGLAAAHEKGIIHRDLKPENLLVTKDGRVKILDFGLAKLRPELDAHAPRGEGVTLSTATGAGVVLGTVGYMSPEQVRGESVDHRSDIFSFATVLHEMLSGKRPFAGGTTAEVMTAILKEDSPELARPDVSPGLERVVKRCLEKRPEERFQSARDIGFALEAVRDHDPAQPAEVRGPGLLAAVARRPRLTVVAVPGLLAASLLGSWLLTPRPTPQIFRSAQLTFTGSAVAPNVSQDCTLTALATDGARIYFSDFGVPKPPGVGLAYVSGAGGEATFIPTPWQHSLLRGLSPDGGRLLVMEWTPPRPEGPLWLVPTSGGAPQRLGDIVAKDAAWSPDGAALVYSRGEELYLANRDGLQARKLVTTPGQAYWIRWSPDGRRLRFTLIEPQTYRLSLWEVSVDGSGLHALSFQRDERPQECCGEWSRDGRYYVFTVADDEGADLWLSEEGGLFFRGRNGRPRRLTSGSWDSAAAIPSADGKKLYAVELRSSGRLLRYDPRSRLFSAFPIPAARSVEFSPDGAWLLYVEVRGTKQALKRSRLDGSEALQLTSPPMVIWTPRWSPDGQQIAFTGKLPGQPFKAYVVSRDGGTPQQVLEGERNEVDLDWSSDGRSLMFGRPPDYMAEPGVTKAIHVVDLHTKQVSTLAGSEGRFSSRWSPGGRYVVAMPLDQHKLTLFDSRTLEWKDLAGPGIGVGIADACVPMCGNPRWSPDGRYVYVTSGGNVLRVALTDRRVERVIGAGDLGPTVQGAAIESLAPDGSLLVGTGSASSNIHALDWRVP